ncbi:MAG: hypothetical protein H3C47_10445 [Candidatus Cloacimonetes bacterium]|nr:hypothetical protein [Candidatus Cloacimonadota bacterium]
MLLKLFLKLSIPIRLIADILGIALLALLLWPVLDAVNQWSPGILKKTFTQQIALNFLYAIVLGQICAFSGFTIAYMIRHFYPGKWLVFFVIGVLILMPETTQILGFGPIAKSLSGKDMVLFSHLSACLWPTLFAILCGSAMIHSIGSETLLTMKHLGAPPGASLFRFILPRFFKPLIFTGFLFSSYILGHGVSLYQEMSIKSYSLSWLFIGPADLLGQSQQAGMAYSILLGFSLIVSFLCLAQINPGSVAVSPASIPQSSKPVKRKKSKKRKPLPGVTPAVQQEAPVQPEPEPQPEPEAQPEPPKKKMGLKISLSKNKADS